MLRPGLQELVVARHRWVGPFVVRGGGVEFGFLGGEGDVGDAFAPLFYGEAFEDVVVVLGAAGAGAAAGGAVLVGIRYG